MVVSKKLRKRFLVTKKEATPAQIAHAGLLSHNAGIVPIPGTTTPDCFNENISAVDAALTADDGRLIEEAASKMTLQGERYQP